MSGNGHNNQDLRELLRQLPSVDRLLMAPATFELGEEYSRELLVEALRAVLAQVRHDILAGQRTIPMNATLVELAREWLEELLAPTLQPVINATGVIIHTNLGRAPLSEAARQAVQASASAYSTLEYNLDEGERGSRTVHAAGLLNRITGAEAALVVNNNAAAVLLMLSALCQHREVIISRGQLVEIGGSFRIPDIMVQSGAHLVEVGTTNRTHLRDYASAINENTAALLVAHPSNFKIVGFTSEPPLAELAQLAHEHGLPLLYDQGSGALLSTIPYGLDGGPTVLEALEAGVDLATFSGDKLLGGPQAGIICGRRAMVDQLKRHPLARAVRPDKLCLAALTATLGHYLTGEAIEKIPVWQMIARSQQQLAETAAAWATSLQEAGLLATVVEGRSTVGGGSLPGTTLPTHLLAIDHHDLATFSARLRTQNQPPVIGRISDNRLLLDPRTVLPWQEDTLLQALVRHDRSNRSQQGH